MIFIEKLIFIEKYIIFIEKSMIFIEKSPSPTPVPGGAPCPFPLFKDLRPGVVGGSGVVVVGVRLSLAGPLATPPGCAPQLAPLPPAGRALTA